MSRICIIEFPSNLGLKEPKPGIQPGVKKLPAWFREHLFHEKLDAIKTIRLNAPRYAPKKDPNTGVLNAKSIAGYAKDQAEIIHKVLDEKLFPVVIGGDCSILIGTALALKQRGNYGFFYLDGHTDYMSVDLSQTGGAGGMAAAISTGYGPDLLTNIYGLKPYLKPEHLWCVGNREYDDEYENEIQGSNAHYISLKNLRKTGVEKCAGDFLTQVSHQKLDGFWIHLDVDVLDDEVMPCVDSRTSDGLSYKEFNSLLQALAASDYFAGIEITILDPDLDENGKYTKEFILNFTNTFNSARRG